MPFHWTSIFITSSKIVPDEFTQFHNIWAVWWNHLSIWAYLKVWRHTQDSQLQILISWLLQAPVTANLQNWVLQVERRYQLHFLTSLSTVILSAVLFFVNCWCYVILVYFFVLYGIFILIISINFTGLICHWQNAVGYFHTYSALEFLWSSRKNKEDNGFPSWGFHWCRHLMRKNINECLHSFYSSYSYNISITYS